MSIVLDLDVTEHAGVALSYDLEVKTLEKQLAETGREKNKVEALLTGLNQTIGNNCLGEFGIIPTYANNKTKTIKTPDKDKGKGNKDHKGGNGKKQDKKGRHRDNWQPDNTWGKNSWQGHHQQPWHDWNNNNWPQNTQQTEETPDTQPETDASPKSLARKGRKKGNN